VDELLNAILVTDGWLKIDGWYCSAAETFLITFKSQGFTFKICSVLLIINSDGLCRCEIQTCI